MGSKTLYVLDFITTMAAGIYFIVRPQDVTSVFKNNNSKLFPFFVKILGVLVIFYGLYKLYNVIRFFTNQM